MSTEKRKKKTEITQVSKFKHPLSFSCLFQSFSVFFWQKPGLQYVRTIYLYRLKMSLMTLQAYLPLLHFTLLCFAETLFFTKCGKPASRESTAAVFPRACAHFCPSVTFWELLQYFKRSHYYDMCYGDLRSVLFDVTIVFVLGCHNPHPHKMVNLINE